LRIFVSLAVIAGVAGLIAFAALRDNGDTTQTASPARTTTPLLPSVVIITPSDGSTASNPIEVRMAIAGVKFAPESDPATTNAGHLHVIIDGGVPSPGQIVPQDATHLDLADASFRVTIPTLSAGPHTIAAVFTNSTNIVSNPPLTDTTRITVTE
jgi:hypothetical protein